MCIRMHRLNYKPLDRDIKILEEGRNEIITTKWPPEVGPVCKQAMAVDVSMSTFALSSLQANWF